MTNKYLFIPDFSGGGAEKIFLNLALFAKENSSESLSVITITNEGDLYDWCKSNGIQHISLGFKSNRFKWLFLPFVLFSLLKLLKPGDKVLSAIFYCNLVLSFLSLFSKVKIYSSQHTVKSVKDNRNNFFIRFILKKLTMFSYNRSECVICVSEYIKNDLVKTYGIDNKKLIVIYNPVAYDVKFKKSLFVNINKKNDVIRLLCIGRLINDKGFDIAIESVALLISQGIRIELDILGQGPLEWKLKALVKNLNIEPYVNFRGFVSNVNEYIEKTNIVLIPSRLEGFGNVAVEAISYGKPVIVSNAPGGLSEIINDDILGSVVDLQPEDICDSIKYWINNDNQNSAIERIRISKYYLPCSLYPQYLKLFK